MGTGSSMVANEESDEDLQDEEADELGVMTNIPVECPPHRKPTNNLIRSVGSFGRKKTTKSKRNVITKSTSLRSALSLDFETENDKLRNELEACRSLRQTEVKELLIAKQKLQSENRRLKSELKVVHSTCTKLVNDREMALEAKEQALQRAFAFEKERDKVQRQFKIFREAKEKEIQEYLQTQHELQERIQYLQSHYGIDTSRNGEEVVGEGNKFRNDWWTMSLGSDHSLDELTQASVVQGPDYSQAIMESNGVFTTVSRDDWNATLQQPLSPTSKNSVDTPIIRIYLSAPQDMNDEVQILHEVYLKKLECLCEDNGRSLVLVHVKDDFNSDIDVNVMDEICRTQINQSNVFVAFLGQSSNRFTVNEYHHGHLDSPGKRFALFCFTNSRKSENKEETIEKLKNCIRKSSNRKIFDDYSTPEEGVHFAYTELKGYLKKTLESSVSDSSSTQSAISDEWIDTPGLDAMIDEQEQFEALTSAADCRCEVDFTKYFSDLNVHLSSTGLLLPLLVMGEDGSGKSLLVAKWINLQQATMPGRLILYHFVGTTSSSSACPILMLRRFTIQLLKYMRSTSTLPCDPVNLEEEFLRCLEKVSAKIYGGVTIVIDSADRLQDVRNHMQWLLDPLPVGTRVILSVSTNTCANAWKLWPTLNLEPLSKDNQRKMVSSLCSESIQDQINKAITECSNKAISNPRFLSLVVAEINSKRNADNIDEILSECLSKKDNVELLGYIIQQQTSQTLATSLKLVLQYIALSRNGLTEPELLSLLPLEWAEWLYIYLLLHNTHILSTRVGQVMFASQQVHSAVCLLFNLNDDSAETQLAQQRLVAFYHDKIKNCLVTRRLIDEMPWLLCKTRQKQALKECLLDLNVFSCFFERGRISELVQYWKYVGEEQSNIGQLYLEVIKNMNGANEEPSAGMADILEAVGLFLKSLGLLSQAAPPQHKALEIRESTLDPDHPLVAQSLHHLAELYAHWGNFSAAEAFYKQAIEIIQNVFGAEHQALIKDLEGLSILYKKNEKYNLAEAHHKRANVIRRKSAAMTENQNMKKKILQLEEVAVGTASSEVAKAMNELGVLLYLQNNHDSAESFLQRSLDMREEVLGKDHPDVAQSLHNLAALYNDQKMCDKAEPLYKRALEIRMKTLPHHNASLASTVKHLAVLFRKQGKYAEAEPLYRRALEARISVLGENHPSVGTALNNLAVVLCLQGKQSEALPLYERALKIYEQSLGAHHPRVAEAMINLAKLYFDQGQHETAVQLYKQASEIQSHEQSSQSRLSIRMGSGDVHSSASKRSPSVTSPDSL
ncbi:nephrocystin-3 [Exaiptasia diaphana]|uniref:Nephrocystin-3 n=1 Tax=Exaiptasia diaphana TaxID=2652724 RepID=A0A913YBU4_EXADI|nr:nephrocystin-3 [Exaiptasia diaphana]KXJ28343.1 Nephrocystin-3 [Exaiptasia diaphana]